MRLASPRDHAYLAKTLALLDDASTCEERVAALEAANQQLAALGLSWGSLAAELPIADDEPGQNVALAATLMRAGRGVITAWETKFLIGIEAFDALSPRQQQQLAAIRRRVRSAGVAAFVGS